MDSPRGRIDLMRGLRRRADAMTPTVAAHFDRCLGCMACVTACPSGVQYDVSSRRRARRWSATYRRGLGIGCTAEMIFQLFPYPRRLRAMAAFLLLYVWTGLRWLVRTSWRAQALSRRRLRQLEALSRR